MQKTILFKNPFFLFIVMLLFIASCNNNDSGTAKTDTPDSPTTNEIGGGGGALNLTGTLDTLFMPASDFPKKQPAPPQSPRLTFRFFDTLNSFTLHGWVGVVFGDAAPTIRLSIGKPTTVSYGSGSYFGNLILRNYQVENIRDSIDKYNSSKVYFIPEIDNTGNFVGQIVYRILVSNDKVSPTTPVSISAISTAETTNPSPPRNTQ
jgi:hypothetical protein